MNVTNETHETQSLTPLMHEFIVGTVLGDGSLIPSTKKPVTQWYYFVEHGEKQKSYLYHKYELLKPFITTPPRELKKKKLAKNGNQLIHYAFSTPL